MMEYIFFNDSISRRFAEFAQVLGIPCQERHDKMGLVIAVPEDLDDLVANRLETYYAMLMDDQAELVETAEPDLKHVAAISITLADGRPCTIRIEPAMMGRLMECLSIDEIHQLATTIARSVENPDDKPLCHT
ncbi:hypothetical protein [Sulfuricella sp.]|uniref:hypothetical protein n=1 Tax=Sulfuricella sp. TaxID=2099377 RepID=UPI002BDD2967|nr:hypothetical protein [Sulfuricella sp.]HUX62439.1 hypothetical protein [Sulfuricella sp.]